MRRPMQIFVGVPAGAGRVKAGQKLTLEVESDWSIDRLKEQISAEHGILPAAQRLSVNSVVMVGDRKLADYEIRMEAELQLVERPSKLLACPVIIILGVVLCMIQIR